MSFEALADVPSGDGPNNLGGFDLDSVVAEVDEDSNKIILGMKKECTKDQLEFCAGSKYKSGDHTMCKYCVRITDASIVQILECLYVLHTSRILPFFQGLGKKCPYYLDPATNDMTGRVIEDQKTIDYILKLHNEVRSKIALGRCDQPKAGCMWPLVSHNNMWSSFEIVIAAF